MSSRRVLIDRSTHRGPPTALARRASRVWAFPCAVALLGAMQLQAQTVPTGYQEYFVVGHEQHVWDMLEVVATSEGGGGFSDGTNSVVKLNGGVISYDASPDMFDNSEYTMMVDFRKVWNRACRETGLGYGYQLKRMQRSIEKKACSQGQCSMMPKGLLCEIW